MSDLYLSQATAASTNSGVEIVEIVTPTTRLTRILQIPNDLDGYETDSNQSDIKGVPFSIANLKDMIMNSENKVKIRPILLAVTGLPDSGDSDAISHLLKYHAEKSPYLPMSRKSYSPKEAKSITYYELVAVGVHRLQIVEVTSEFSCSFGIMSAFKKKITENSQLLKPTAIHVAGKKQGSASQSFFNEDPSLERHLEYLFQNLSQFEYLNDEAKESNLTPEEKEFANHIRKLPSGTSLINIWNISINTTTLSCLTALSGYLYRSNTWAFLDIERDMDKLDQPPEPHHGELQITKWRPRLHYLLRVGKMSHGSENGADREGCCTVFARYDENFNGNLKAKVKELEKDIKEAAKEIGVADLFESKVQPINFSQSSSFPDDQSQHLYQKLHQLICETPYKEVPLSWLFLRSLFYQQREKIIISKSALKAKAGCCGIDEAAFEEFCQFYASFGSIIDFTLINPDHNLIVLSPIEFLRTLDRILQPNEESFLWKHPMTEMGIVSERLCNILFEVECSDYMDALISFGLAVKVTSCIQDKENVLQLDKSLRTEAIYFVPQLRKRKSTIRSVDPNAVYFVTSIDSPTVNKETQFVKHMLALHPTAVLIPCHERNKTIIHDVDTGTTITMVSFSPATMISISNPIDKVHESVVRACHEIAQSTKALKYKFVIICAKRNKTISPSSILSCCCHVLPNEELECDGCTSKVKNLKAWNNALQKLSIPEHCQIQEDFTTHHINMIVKAVVSTNLQYVSQLAEVLGYTDNESFKGLEGGTLVMQMLLDWLKTYNEEQKASASLRMPLDEGPRKALARKLVEKSCSLNSCTDLSSSPDTEEKEQARFFLKLARNLDIYVSRNTN